MIPKLNQLLEPPRTLPSPGIKTKIIKIKQNIKILFAFFDKYDNQFFEK